MKMSSPLALAAIACLAGLIGYAMPAIAGPPSMTVQMIVNDPMHDVTLLDDAGLLHVVLIADYVISGKRMPTADGLGYCITESINTCPADAMKEVRFIAGDDIA